MPGYFELCTQTHIFHYHWNMIKILILYTTNHSVHPGKAFIFPRIKFFILQQMRYDKWTPSRSELDKSTPFP